MDDNRNESLPLLERRLAVWRALEELRALVDIERVQALRAATEVCKHDSIRRLHWDVSLVLGLASQILDERFRARIDARPVDHEALRGSALGLLELIGKVRLIGHWDLFRVHSVPVEFQHWIDSSYSHIVWKLGMQLLGIIESTRRDTFAPRRLEERRKTLSDPFSQDEVQAIDEGIETEVFLSWCALGSRPTSELRMTPTKNESDIQWSDWDLASQWARTFGVSAKTFKERCENGLIVAQERKPNGGQRGTVYRVSVADIPRGINGKQGKPKGE